MLSPEGHPAVVKPQTLPHTIPEKKARVEDRDVGVVAWDQRAVDVDEDRRVAVVGVVVGGQLSFFKFFNVNTFFILG